MIFRGVLVGRRKEEQNLEKVFFTFFCFYIVHLCHNISGGVSLNHNLPPPPSGPTPGNQMVNEPSNRETMVPYHDLGLILVCVLQEIERLNIHGMKNCVDKLQAHLLRTCLHYKLS